MSETRDKFVVIGQLGSTYGVKGWLKVISYSESNILDYDPWYFSDNSGWKIKKILGAREHGKYLVVQLEGIKTPEEAQLLTGKKIAVRREQLPTLAKNEYYWTDLEGLNVFSQTGENLGKVAYLIATGSNDVLVVQGDQEYLIPFLLDETVIEINLEERTMRVNWDIEGASKN